MSGDVAQGGEFVREASAEERAFHAAQSGDGGRGESRDAGVARDPAPSESREPREAREPREPREPREAREPREGGHAGGNQSGQQGGSQAPLDLPPPPAAKPFVVWSSSPGDSSNRRDE